VTSEEQKRHWSRN